jgi:hypothetical protein
MERWEVMAAWMARVYDRDLFRQSGHMTGGQLPRAEQAWRQFCVIPIDLLQTPSGKADDTVFRSVSAFIMYHWEAGGVAGLSLGNALCGRYNAAFTLLRSFVDFLLKGILYQCLAYSRFREAPSSALKSTDALTMLAGHLSSMMQERDIDVTELESNSAAIFDLLTGDWMLSAFRLEIDSIIPQLAAWGILAELHDDPARAVRELYGRLSENVHQRIELTDIQRAIEEGAKIFEYPAPILAESLSEFLDEFHLAMEVGVIAELNLLYTAIPRDRLRPKCQRLLHNEAFGVADLRQATELLKRWAA